MTAAWNAFPMLDRLLDDVMTGVAGTAFGASTPVRSFTPALDVRANEDEIVFTADVPGLKHEDIEITLDDGVLTIKGQRRYEGNGKDKVWLGRSYGAFSRSFTLPDTVDPERLSAELADGVLTVRVAQQPKAKPRKITIAPQKVAPQLAQDERADAAK
ncbi:MAG: Heat shock protein Hsp20 family [Labilithrix sp.]|nr:Heat shock protein Hsp20 family [Labilithrix sp.]